MTELIVAFHNCAYAFNFRKVSYKFSNTLIDEKMKYNCVFSMCIKWKYTETNKKDISRPQTRDLPEFQYTSQKKKCSCTHIQVPRSEELTPHPPPQSIGCRCAIAPWLESIYVDSTNNLTDYISIPIFNWS